jgi:hypothetical protein
MSHLNLQGVVPASTDRSRISGTSIKQTPSNWRPTSVENPLVWGMVLGVDEPQGPLNHQDLGFDRQFDNPTAAVLRLASALK